MSLYRPFTKKSIYLDKHFINSTYQWFDIFRKDQNNRYIGFLSIGSNNPLTCLATDRIFDLAVLKTGNGGTQCLPLHSFSKEGKQIDNITDWGLEQFTTHYKNSKISKEDIFHYVYAVLHNPAYRKKYELNLKREFPRIPLYDDFFKWRDWGKQLMELHIGYETVQPYKLKLIEQVSDTFKVSDTLAAPKPKLKADKASGIIILDDRTELHGIPKEAWEYKLGNRSALEWILDQYKEKKPSDPTIAEKFNTYRFADYKDHVIDLLKRVCTVSVETMKVVREMEKESL